MPYYSQEEINILIEKVSDGVVKLCKKREAEISAKLEESERIRILTQERIEKLCKLCGEYEYKLKQLNIEI